MNYIGFETHLTSLLVELVHVSRIIVLFLPMRSCGIRYHDGYTDCSGDDFSNCSGVLLGTYILVKDCVAHAE